jgi:hypothetical protein
VAKFRPPNSVQQRLNGLVPNPDVRPDSDIKISIYSGFAVVTGVHYGVQDEVRFTRIWIRQDDGWLALLHQGSGLTK